MNQSLFFLSYILLSILDAIDVFFSPFFMIILSVIVLYNGYNIIYNNYTGTNKEIILIIMIFGISFLRGVVKEIIFWTRNFQKILYNDMIKNNVISKDQEKS